ncbi:uncharacterized protein LOC124209881 [Daphnia pulex]|uniref:uncharacterized protein LOC124209881 n=1 Tax=Daphnia pulex TaxID=6669 RepID=UPI001EDEB9F5|nr:uncharacterized protein LOC124209881 [Daphnia pulex]XP_046464069.1 uncharacterized protein LOC124209881 [Daphnia pulex]
MRQLQAGIIYREQILQITKISSRKHYNRGGGGGVYPHGAQVELDKLITKNKWKKRENTYPKGYQHACTLLVFLQNGLKYNITIINSIKDYAVTDAYMKMFETLYRSEKVTGYIFRQKEEIPVAAEQLPVSSFTATNGVEYSSSDVRYKNRPMEGYVVFFQGATDKM